MKIKVDFSRKDCFSKDPNCYEIANLALRNIVKNTENHSGVSEAPYCRDALLSGYINLNSSFFRDDLFSLDYKVSVFPNSMLKGKNTKNFSNFLKTVLFRNEAEIDEAGFYLDYLADPSRISMALKVIRDYPTEWLDLFSIENINENSLKSYIQNVLLNPDDSILNNIDHAVYLYSLDTNVPVNIYLNGQTGPLNFIRSLAPGKIYDSVSAFHFEYREYIDPIMKSLKWNYNYINSPAMLELYLFSNMKIPHSKFDKRLFESRLHRLSGELS